MERSAVHHSGDSTRPSRATRLSLPSSTTTHRGATLAIMALLGGPLGQLAAWIEHARTAGEPEPDAMTLATSTRDGHPSARIVLCRGVDERGVRFFTNYDSPKGRELG